MVMRPKTGRPTLPNAGVEAAYRRKLDALLDRMSKEVSAEILAAYAENQNESAQPLSQDAVMPPGGGELWVSQIIDGLLEKWVNIFDQESQSLASWFTNQVASHSRRGANNALKEAGLTIKLTMSPQTQRIIENAIDENVGLIKSIPSKYLDDVRGMVDESVKKGRDLGGLTKGLEEKYGISRRRAVVISRDQSNKATEALTVSRYKEVGITEAIWVHRSGSKEPRKSHLKMNGKKFKLDGPDKGLYDEDVGRNVMPGELINCRCTCRPVIPEQPVAARGIYAKDSQIMRRLPILGPGGHRRVSGMPGHPSGVPRRQQAGHGQQPVCRRRVADSAGVRVPVA